VSASGSHIIPKRFDLGMGAVNVTELAGVERASGGLGVRLVAHLVHALGVDVAEAAVS